MLIYIFENRQQFRQVAGALQSALLRSEKIFCKETENPGKIDKKSKDWITGTAKESQLFEDFPKFPGISQDLPDSHLGNSSQEFDKRLPNFSC